ncbi:DNA polymerase/3'-5' exonuclease PolX [bacterium CPR1]|nr:DNA polymerase/3'-5' exonuclease PolX [bacterium CPR1]
MVDNQAVARTFEEIADFLELKGENPFKIKAYQRAARTIQSLDRPLASLAEEGGLTEIPGIGKAIAEKIGEMLQGGKMTLHEELRSEFPGQILELITVPGLGPKKAAVLYHELGVGSLADLERAIQEGALRDLKGFGAKTEANLAEGLKRLRASQGEERMPLPRARAIVATLIESLSQVSGVERLEVAGSARRGKETVGDLDLVCVAADSGPIMEAFCSLVSPERILARGETKSSLLYSKNLQVDLRVVPAESFGAAMQYFTGSKDHNVSLRVRAEKNKWKLNEYGLFDDSGENLASRTEEEIYRKLGLDLIPPELREGLNEIELAEKHQLPRLVMLEDLRGNLHAHTTWSDGQHSVEEMARAALRMGLEYLAITDHSPWVGVANGLDVDRLRQLKVEIDQVNALNLGVTLLWGSEVDIRPDGQLDYSDEILAQLDVVVASVHSHLQMGKDEMTARVLKAMENPHVDILGHPSGRLLGRRPGYDMDWEEVYKAAARFRTALEINGYPNRLDLRDVQARRARELGAMLAIGADAHSSEHLDYLALGVGVARRAWATPENVLNTLSLADLKRYLTQKEGAGRGA